MVIRSLSPREWELFREVRLTSLRDAPDAFGSTLERELAFAEEDWKGRLERDDSRTFVALSDESRSVGLVVGAPYNKNAEDGNKAGLFAMWVDASERKKGIGGLLVEAVVRWAEETGATELLLDVADNNFSAIAFYQAKGFLRTGVEGSLPAPREHIREHQRVLRLRSADA